jgi:hypothetical protein
LEQPKVIPNDAPLDIATHIQRALAVIHPEVSKFTFPLFAADKRGRPDLFASSVLVNIDGVSVLLTAAHAVHEITSSGSDVYLGARTIVPLRTTFARTSEDGQDEFDLAAAKIPVELLRSEVMDVLPQSRFCLQPYTSPPHMRCIHGYPATKNETRKRADESKNVFTKYGLTYAGASNGVVDNYERYGKRDSTHIALQYQRKHQQQSRSESGELVTPPHPRGISGGGLWSIPDSFNPQLPFLDGIAIEFHEKSLVFATRIEHVVAFVRESLL